MLKYNEIWFLLSRNNLFSSRRSQWQAISTLAMIQWQVSIKSYSLLVANRYSRNQQRAPHYHKQAWWPITIVQFQWSKLFWMKICPLVLSRQSKSEGSWLGKIIEANSFSVKDILGYSRNEMTGNWLGRYLTNDAVEKFENIREKYCKENFDIFSSCFFHEKFLWFSAKWSRSTANSEECVWYLRYVRGERRKSLDIPMSNTSDSWAKIKGNQGFDCGSINRVNQIQERKQKERKSYFFFSS